LLTKKLNENLYAKSMVELYCVNCPVNLCGGFVALVVCCQLDFVILPLFYISPMCRRSSSRLVQLLALALLAAAGYLLLWPSSAHKNYEDDIPDSNLRMHAAPAPADAAAVVADSGAAGGAVGKPQGRCE